MERGSSNCRDIEGVVVLETVKINRKIIDRFVDSRELITETLEDQLIGKDVVWSKGRYQGRKCQITNVHWEAPGWFDNLPIDIMVIVRTYRIDSRIGYYGNEEFIDDGDHYHRQFRPLGFFSIGVDLGK